MAAPKRIVRKAPAQPPRRSRATGVGRFDASEERSAEPFKSKAHANRVKMYENWPEAWEIQKQATIKHFGGSWDMVPFLDPDASSWTPEKAYDQYVRRYAEHLEAGKSTAEAHLLAGLHSTLFDRNGNPIPGYGVFAREARREARRQAGPERKPGATSKAPQRSARAPAKRRAPTRRRTGLGMPFEPEDLQSKVRGGVVFERDPDVVDRGLRGHASTLNKLGEMAAAKGLRPHRGRAPCAYDLAWETPSGLAVAEVKSLTPENETTQLRLGLGQVLDYADAVAGSGRPVARLVLAVERAPSEKDRWVELCGRAGVTLVWPQAMARAFR